MRSYSNVHPILAAIGIGVVVVLAHQTAAASAGPAAEITPSEMALDQAAVLRVAADGDKPPVLPSVDGLSFQRTGQRTEMTSINGSVSQHSWVLYQVVAARPGTYTIPIGGRALVLQVRPAGVRSAPTASAPTGPLESKAIDAAQIGSLALLRVTLPNRSMYVGQAVPITFNAYFRPGTEVTLTGPPSLGITAFTMSQLSERPRQRVESIGGVPYRVATWTGLVSAAMPGRYPTNATLPIVARYREVSRRPVVDPFAGMLNDEDAFPSSSALRSFMSRSLFGGGLDDLFGQVHEREMTLRAPVRSVEVQPLPTRGRPADFSGAVGHFDLHATLAPSSGVTFDPMSLKIEISGSGNFDRVSTTGIPSSRDWKSYPPSATLTPSGKVFEQAVVPQRSGRVELPPVSFSFFDPDRNQYTTRSIAPIAVQVVPPSADSMTSSTSASIAQSAVAPATQMRPNRLEEGRHIGTLLPLYRRPWFWPALAIPWLALVVLVAQSRVRGRVAAARARRREVRAAVAQQLVTMRRAAAARDPARFFEAARFALQKRLGERWGIAPEEVTPSEVERRMGERGAPIVAALTTAEHIRYGAAMPEPSLLTKFDEAIEHQLDQLENQP